MKFVKILYNLIQKKYIFLAICTGISILAIGYHFGTNDQTIHIPFLKKLSDLSMFPNDNFFKLQDQHYSYFWYLFIPLYLIGILEPSLFILHIIFTYFTFWAIWNIAETIFGNKTITRLSVLSLMFPHVSFCGFPMIEFQMLNRTAILPFLLISVNLLLKNRIWLAFLIMGILYNFHALSVNFLLIPSTILIILRIKEIGLKQILFACASFLVTAMPVLIWRMSAAPLDQAVHEDWFRLLNQGVLNNIFSLFSTVPYVIFLNLSGFGLLIIFYISSNYLKKELKLNKVVFSLITLLFTLVIVGFLFYEFYPTTILVQFQITRAIIFAVILNNILWSAYLVMRFNKGLLSKIDLFLLSLMFILSLTPLVPLFVELIYFYVKNFLIRRTVVVTLIIIGIVIVFYSHGVFWKPEINIYSRKDSWYEAQIWARKYTKANAIFITPPEQWWLYDMGWHVESERSNVVGIDDLLEIAFVPSFSKEWTRRMSDIAPGAIDSFAGNILENKQKLRTSYYSLSEKNIINLSKKYKASYFVAENKYTYNLPIVYRNTEYSIYGLILQK